MFQGDFIRFQSVFIVYMIFLRVQAILVFATIYIIKQTANYAQKQQEY